MNIITSAQCKAARAVLGGNASHLAKAVGKTCVSTIFKFEVAVRQPHASTLRVIKGAPEVQGVKFTASGRQMTDSVPSGGCTG